MSTSPDDRVAKRRQTARAEIAARARAQLSEPLLRSAYSLAANSVLTASLGMAFWILAARIYPSDAVGRASVLIAAMVQLSTIAQLNMANALIRFMPGRVAPGRMLVGVYAISALAAVVLGAGFVLVAPQVSEDFAFLTREPLTGVAYVVAVVLWGIFALQDAALTAMRQAPWVLLENGLFGVLKLAGLPLLFAIGSTHGAFIAWVVPMCLLLLPVNWLLFRRIFVGQGPALAHDPSARPFGRWRLARFLALDYLATVFIQTSLTILPLVIIGTLGSRASAHFYIPFTIAVAIDSMFWSMSTSLVSEGALAPQRIAELVRLLVRRVALLVVPVIAILIAAAPLVMAPFGQEYVRESSSVLRILLCASLLRAAMLLAAAIWRLEGRGARIAALEGCMLVGLLCAAIPLAHALGVIGVALAWLGSALVVGCAVLPVLIRHFRSHDEGATPMPREGPADTTVA
jgi:O-antigen/teichoic acid export membrane protein